MSNEKFQAANHYEKIVAIASLLMSKKGYKGASLKEIADLVGIHKSTLFHYFKNKEALLLAVLKIAIEDVTKNLNLIIEDNNLPPGEKLRHAIFNHLTLLVKYKDNVNVYHSEIRFLSAKNIRKYLETRDHYAACFEQIVNQMKAEHTGLFKGLDTKIVTFGILGMSNWTIKWLSGSGRVSIEEVANIFYKMIAEKSA